MEHLEYIRANAKTTYALMEKVDGVVQKVKKKGQEAATQFETLKALIKSQRAATENTRNREPTYAKNGHSRLT